MQSKFAHFLCSFHLFFQLKFIQVLVAIKTNCINVNLLTPVYINSNGIGIYKRRIGFFFYTHCYIFVPFIRIEFCYDLSDLTPGVFGNDGLLGKADLPLQIFLVSFFNTDKFKIAKPGTFYYIDLDAYPVIFNFSNVDLDIGKKFLPPKVVNGPGKIVITGMGEFVPCL